MTADGYPEDRTARPGSDEDDPEEAADERVESGDDRAYAARLGDVLRQRNVAALRAFLEVQAGRYGGERQVEAVRAQSDAEIEQLLHRMILARADLRSLHAESTRWLAGQRAPGPGPGGQPGGTRDAPRPAGPTGRPPRRPGRPSR